MTDIIDLNFIQLGLAYIFVIILMLLMKLHNIKRETELLLASIRMTIQLIFAGNVLVYIFKYPSPIFSILILMLMEIFSVFTIIRKAKIKFSSSLIKIICFSMFTGTILCFSYFIFIVVNISPWYDPRYFIPIGGMIIGNSMTGISLGVNSLTSSILSSKSQIEGSLMLGATPKAATKQIVNNSFDSAILPTINSMLGMGLVFLPGMMTGQILSGTVPTTAIEYQIGIMLGILGSVSLSVIIFLQLGYKTFFNKENQLTI